MIPAAKKANLLNDLKNYKKKYISEKYMDLDESATRLMINDFLTNILGFAALDEVKTEYMIRGTYADYVIQLNGKRHFLVEVKAMNIDLSDKHLRQAVNYAANEGIEWALLTNGREFQFYKVLFTQPIESKLVFHINLNDLRIAGDFIEYLTKISIQKGGLDELWNKITALNPANVASLLYSPTIIAVIKRELKRKYESNFEEEDIMNSITKIIEDPIKDVKPAKFKIERKPRKEKIVNQSIEEVNNGQNNPEIN